MCACVASSVIVFRACVLNHSVCVSGLKSCEVEKMQTPKLRTYENVIALVQSHRLRPLVNPRISLTSANLRTWTSSARLTTRLSMGTSPFKGRGLRLIVQRGRVSSAQGTKTRTCKKRELEDGKGPHSSSSGRRARLQK